MLSDISFLPGLSHPKNTMPKVLLNIETGRNRREFLLLDCVDFKTSTQPNIDIILVFDILSAWFHNKHFVVTPRSTILPAFHFCYQCIGVGRKRVIWQKKTKRPELDSVRCFLITRRQRYHWARSPLQVVRTEAFCLFAPTRRWWRYISVKAPWQIWPAEWCRVWQRVYQQM